MVGGQASKYRKQEHTVAIGRQAGHLNSGDTNASAGYSGNIYIGSGSGLNHKSGSNCVMIGKDVTAEPAHSRLLIGTGNDHLIKGTFGTTANAEVELNADTIKLPSTIKTQADLAKLSVGQVYVDTSDGNTLKMKLSKSWVIGKCTHHRGICQSPSSAMISS